MADDWRKNIGLNSHSDQRLTVTGKLPFEVWFYILKLENAAHHDPLNGAEMEAIDWRPFYDDDYTPHAALEEDFSNGEP
jgi:hypothetical protein